MISLTGTVIHFILAGESDQYMILYSQQKHCLSIGAKHQILWICLNIVDARVIREFGSEQEGSTSRMDEMREIEGAISIHAWTHDTCTLL